MKLTDRRNHEAFPNTSYRFGTVEQTAEGVRLARDFFGENPLHYYIDSTAREVIVASDVGALQTELERTGRKFNWDRVRAVSNNSEVTITEDTFRTTQPHERELGPTLQEHATPAAAAHVNTAATTIRAALDHSLEERLSTIPDERVGMLLSGGLDSMTVGYLLARKRQGVTAFTLKVHDQDPDVKKSRELAVQYGIPLVEVQVKQNGDSLELIAQSYDAKRTLISERSIAKIAIEKAVAQALKLSNNPKKDNAYCATAMYLIAHAVRAEGIKTVFCGEGPNEMINDYGYVPSEHGYEGTDKGNVPLREALTFGAKKTDRQMGRGGLAKHATARMHKVFAGFDIRLEAPFYDAVLAKTLCNMPHETSYDTIKQHLTQLLLADPSMDRHIKGTSKEKFQDGSGLSRILAPFDQARLSAMFETLYGVHKQY